jgi:outer membrane protein assembly factor BamB
MILLTLALLILAGCSKKSGPPVQATSSDPPAALKSARQLPPVRPANPVGVYTYHNDLARTGLNPNETILTLENVNSRSFGKKFAVPVDGQIYAQPLYVPDVSIPGGTMHNVVHVATQNNSVYAFDADQEGPPLWHRSLLEGGTPVPASDYGCDQILPQMGITGTPVIDPATNTLYVVAMVKHVTPEGPVYAHRLHALDIATGEEKFGGPVTIAGSVPGIGAGQVNRVLSFEAFPHLNRPGLALANGVIYIAFGSHCDLGTFHGWLFAYNAGKPGMPALGAVRPLTLRASFNTTRNGIWGSIWQAGGAPAVDREGHVFVMTSNGTFNATDYGDSFVKLTLGEKSLRPIDSFTPYDQKLLEDQDLDLGSSGPILLPDQPGSHPHLMVGADKRGAIYVLNRDRMGGYHRRHDQIVQSIRGAVSPIFTTGAYWNGNVYFGGVGDVLKALCLTEGQLSTSAVTRSSNKFDYPGTSPSISADGAKNAIVWALQTDQYYAKGPAILHAYDASDLSRELYRSGQAGPGDIADPAVKFTTPTIADGKVFFGTQDHLDVYGLLR